MSPQIAEVFDLAQWAAWFAQLEREFIFLLVLPFVIAIIGLWASFLQREDKDRQGSDSGEDSR